MMTVIALLILIPSISIIVYENIYNKFYGNYSGSAVQRFRDTTAAIKVISTNPVLGIGVDYDNLQNNFKSVDIDNSRILNYTSGGNNKEENRMSNSLLRLFVYFGIPLSIYILISLYNQPILRGNQLAMFLIIIISMCFTPLLFHPFFITLIMSGILYKRLI